MRVCRSKNFEETTHRDAMFETEWVLFDCVAALLQKTGVHPLEVPW